MTEIIKEKLNESFLETFGMGIASEVNPKDYKLDDFDFDSIDAIDVAVALEEKLDILLPDYEMFQVKTVQDIIDLVERELRLKGK